jgi:hypothetical protein
LEIGSHKSSFLLRHMRLQSQYPLHPLPIRILVGSLVFVAHFNPERILCEQISFPIVHGLHVLAFLADGRESILYPVLARFIFVDFDFFEGSTRQHRTIASVMADTTMHCASAWLPSRVGAVDVRYVRALEQEVVEI